jgi:CRP-like cAMP-binding protein
MLEKVNSPLFKNLSTEQLKTLESDRSLKYLSFEKGETIFEQGDMPQYLYVILSGEVQVEKITSTGHHTIVNRFTKSGTVFAEVYLFMRSRPFDYTGISMKKTKLMAFPYDFFFKRKCDIQEIILGNMIVILSEKAFHLNQNLLIIKGHNLKQKIAAYFLTQPASDGKVVLKLNRENWAAYLGVSRPSLSRELMQMEDEGFIRVDKGVIHILDATALENIF